MRAIATRFLAVALLALPAGCLTMAPAVTTAVQDGINPADLIDPAVEADSCGPAALHGLFQVAEQIRRDRRPAVLPPKRSVLVLSGGGAYGAYSAGVLCGWTHAGTRPQFDVVTGVSTGALVATLAFLGPDFDSELQRVYTTLHANDIFRFKHSIRALLSEGLADNAPLAEQIRQIVTPATLCQIADEHRKGRRLYVGTTDLDGHRQVVWDMGAIACKGSVESQDLFVRVLLASAAIPGFFPPVQIPITVNGVPHMERHVDGGVTASLFFRPPWIPPEQRRDHTGASLYDSDLYIIVAGKLYPDPEPVKPRTLNIAASSVSTLLYSQSRAELVKLYTACVLTGMNYHLTAIPQDFTVNASSTDFDPTEMTRMFQEGVQQATTGQVWRVTPPGLEPGERASQRGGTDLILVPSGSHPTAGPASDHRGILRQPVAR
jgi:predicted acylesterase/phospholipase RssA